MTRKMSLKKKEDWLLNESPLESTQETSALTKQNKRWSNRDQKYLRENMHVQNMPQ